MRRELLGLLACPVCRCEFDLRESITEEGEVLEGRLICSGCNKEFPVADGIPKLLTDLEEKSTAERFGYEWRSFPRISPAYERQFLDWISPIDKNFFRGKIVFCCIRIFHTLFYFRFSFNTENYSFVNFLFDNFFSIF